MADDELFSQWGARVRAERVAQGLTQADLADRSGLSQQLVSVVERGLQGGRHETRRALARALNVRPVDLFPYPEDLVERVPAAAAVAT